MKKYYYYKPSFIFFMIAAFLCSVAGLFLVITGPYQEASIVWNAATAALWVAVWVK